MKSRKWVPNPALVVAFVALFAAMGGFGYAAVKMKPNSVRSKNIRDGAVKTGKIADRAVTTPKLAPDAVAPNATNATTAANAMNAAQLGGVAPGHCQVGWLKASMVVDTTPLTDAQPDMDVSGFDCASKADKPIHIHRDAVGRYTVTIAGLGSGVAISSIAGGAPPNAISAASPIDEEGNTAVKTWNNPNEGAFVDGKTFALIVF